MLANNVSGSGVSSSVKRHRDTGSDAVKPVQTVSAFIEYRLENDGTRISELTGGLGYAKRTVHRHVEAREQLEWVVRGGRYRLGLGFLEVGETAWERDDNLARETVEELREETGERAQSVVSENGMAVPVHRATGARAIRTDSEIGKRGSRRATAARRAKRATSTVTDASRSIEHQADRSLPREGEITRPDSIRYSGIAVMVDSRP